MHCGSCTACLDVCPTQAFVGPFELDAQRCISYLTIELQGSIPTGMRPLIGNRIFGCDDCQLVCPWNKFARPSREADFMPRHGLDHGTLAELFGWSEQQFLERAAGSPLYRLGHDRWLRNLAVALGNGPASATAVDALQARLEHPSVMVREHVEWALTRLQALMRKNVSR
jgi:epoxyqueuosine reductase